MDDVRQQVVDRLKQANNILVTVRNNPNVDLLSACIGLALVLDKMDKHAAAVFSGQIPSTIEFLKPEATLEQNPDSLRDFIIALDKSKADKLRYKVEDKVVRIFITPYRTSLSQNDLEFSQGDFNVDAIVALGAHEQQDLDQAVTAHGRILHDATVISINNTPNGSLGAINWQDIGASSISEMVTNLVKDLGKDVLDEQISTALLTGIVAETARFSNEKTTPRTMSLAGELMAAGANQQLVSTKLEEGGHDFGAPSAPTTPPNPSLPTNANGQPPTPPKADDGTLEIDHERIAEQPAPAPPPVEWHEEEKQAEMVPPQIAPNREMLPTPEPHITNVHGSPLGQGPTADVPYNDDDEAPSGERSYLVDSPVLPANTPKPADKAVEPSQANPFDVPPVEPAAPVLGRDLPPLTAPSVPLPQPQAVTSQPSPSPQAAVVQTPPSSPPLIVPSPPVPPVNDAHSNDDETLEEIEEAVHSPHLAQQHQDGADLDAARNQVLEALKGATPPMEPLASLNASPLGEDLHPHTDTPTVTPPANMNVEVDDDGNLKPLPPATPAYEAAPLAESPADRPLDMPLPSVMNIPAPNPVPPTNSQTASPNAPPPVPPPMMPPSFMNPNQ